MYAGFGSCAICRYKCWHEMMEMSRARAVWNIVLAVCVQLVCGMVFLNKVLEYKIDGRECKRTLTGMRENCDSNT